MTINCNFNNYDELIGFCRQILGKEAAEKKTTPAPKAAAPDPAPAKAPAPVKAPAKAPAPVKAADPDPAPTEAEPEESQELEAGYTLEEVRRTFNKLFKAGFKAEATEIIREFGVERLSQIPEDKYPELMEKAKELEESNA